MQTEIADDARARKNLVIIIMCQAILGAQMPMTFVIGGLVGLQLASNPCLATLPISMVVFGSMTTAPWLSGFMQRFGRKAGFMLGASAGFFGALISAYAMTIGSFPGLLLGSYMTGIFMSAQGFFRFAATDTASDAFKPKAVSFAMAGGLLAAIIGPQLVKITDEISPIVFLGTYLAIAALNLIGMIPLLWLDIPKPPRVSESGNKGRSRIQMLKTPVIAVAIICGMVSYSLMNLVMTSTPLAVVGCGYSKDWASDIVSAHVLAMFVPSFFTGHLIARFGVERIIATGLFILAGAGAVALAGIALGNFFIALILLGIGWNFGFIGATTMLARHHSPEERGRLQGMNDMIIFGCVTVASLASGGLMNCSGGDPVAGWNAVNIAMIPFLVLAGSALIWLSLGQRKPVA